MKDRKTDLIEDEEDVIKWDGTDQVQEEPRPQIVPGYQLRVQDDLLRVILLHNTCFIGQVYMNNETHQKCRWLMFNQIYTCSKIDDDVNHKDGVAKAVEGNPANTQVIVEERDGHWQDDQVGHQQEQHPQIPVKSVQRNNHWKFEFICFQTSPRKSISRQTLSFL